MGDLYISIERQFPNGRWSALFQGPSTALEPTDAIGAFGDYNPEYETDLEYIDPTKMREMQVHPRCPWRCQEPYWLRLISGQEFVNRRAYD